MFLPKLVDPSWESELEVIRNTLLKEYEDYKDKMIELKKKELGESFKADKILECDNHTPKKKRGLKKLKKRINKGDIVLVQPVKSEK